MGVCRINFLSYVSTLLVIGWMHVEISHVVKLLFLLLSFCFLFYPFSTHYSGFVFIHWCYLCDHVYHRNIKPEEPASNTLVNQKNTEPSNHNLIVKPIIKSEPNHLISIKFGSTFRLSRVESVRLIEEFQTRNYFCKRNPLVKKPPLIQS